MEVPDEVTDVTPDLGGVGDNFAAPLRTRACVGSRTRSAWHGRRQRAAPAGLTGLDGLGLSVVSLI